MTAPVLIVTGGPGAGKTTVAGILAERADRAVHLDADRFFNSIGPGRILPWLPEAHEQNRVVMDAVVAAAGSFAAGGYLTIVDGIVIPGWFYEPLRDGFRERGSDVAYAVLRPSLDEAIGRSATRAEQPMADADVVRQLWRSFSDLGPLERHVIEDAGEGPDAVAAEVWDRFTAGDLDV